MARCNDCNKFVSYDSETEPEVDNLEVDDEGNVTGSVQIVNCCAECGGEMRECTFDLESDHTSEVEEHKRETGLDPKLEIEESGTERIQKTEGKGRGARTFYGASVDYTITCACEKCKAQPHKTLIIENHWEDYVQASSMDEM